MANRLVAGRWRSVCCGSHAMALEQARGNGTAREPAKHDTGHRRGDGHAFCRRHTRRRKLRRKSQRCRRTARKRGRTHQHTEQWMFAKCDRDADTDEALYHREGAGEQQK